MYIWSPICRSLHTTYGVSGRLPAGCLYTPCRWCGGPLLACVVQAEGEDRETPRPVGGSGKSGVGLQRGYRGIPTPAKRLQRNKCRYLPRRFTSCRWEDTCRTAENHPKYPGRRVAPSMRQTNIAGSLPSVEAGRLCRAITTSAISLKTAVRTIRGCRSSSDAEGVTI